MIFQENESFDHYFGTFPGANGIYSDGQHPRAPKDSPGFTQTYLNTASGKTVTVEPFLIGPDQNANALDSVDHSHKGMASKIHVANNTAAMDQFAFAEYTRYASKADPAKDTKGTQFARLVMSHVDCDTIPFLWQYASRFVLFDKIFATENSPSTPNTLALIAGQAGETQSTKDRRADDYISSNLTFASLPLTFLGRDVKAVMSQDLDKGFDEPDIQRDIEFIARLDGNPVAWRWY